MTQSSQLFSASSWIYRGLLFAMGLVVSVILFGTPMGCARSISSFDLASGSLIRPVLDLELAQGKDGNLRRIFHRIRWFEQLREWEIQLQLHSLGKWLGTSTGARLKQCGSSCSRCFSGNENYGDVALACWTQIDPITYDKLQDSSIEKQQLDAAKLSGIIRLEVPTLGKAGGESYLSWDQVCFPASRKYDKTKDGLCLGGLSAYKVDLDDEVNPTRTDALWVMRVSVHEGTGNNVLERRLDGVLGSLQTSRITHEQSPLIQRRAILIDEKNVMYHDFQVKHCKTDNPRPAYRDCCGSVRILAIEGQFLCGFVGAGTPTQLQQNCWPTALQSTPSLQFDAFDVRCIQL